MLLQQGAKSFNLGQYYEAHEFWEALWIKTSGPRKAYLQGLILLCGALIHLQNKNFEVSKKLSQNCQKKLAQGELFGIRIHGLEKFLQLMTEDSWSQAIVQMPNLQAQVLNQDSG